jgi:hypothetical protein
MPPNISRTCALVASIRAPVPLMRPQSAPVRSPADQPGRSAGVAFDTRSAEPSEPTDDFHWRDGLARRFRSAWWQAALPTTDSAATGHLLAPAYRSNGGSQFPSTGAGFRPPGGGEPLCPIWMAGGHPRPGLWPPVITCLRTGRRRQHIAAERARSASDLPRCSLSLSSMWLAVFKMMHRSGGRQGYGQLLAAFAGLTDRERSPQNFSSALWHP